MPDTIIEIQDLGKKYVLGAKKKHRPDTIVEELTLRFADLAGRAARPFRKNGTAAPRREVFWALRDVSFDVELGDRVGIIGRNGAGKSTLLKILSRITEPTTGSARIRGRVASLLEVGTGFHRELTGRENIFLNGAILGMGRREIQRKFDEIVAFSEVEKFIDTPVKHYSSGMYVRLAFSVAAHLEPDVLIVDEVLAVGDASFQKKCLGKMSDVAEEGRTILFVSHNLAAVENLCTRAVWLEAGRVRSAGDTHEIVREYLHQPDIDSAQVDVSCMTRKYGDGSFRFTGVALRDSTGTARNTFASGEAVEVEVSWTGARPVSGTVIMLNFALLNGQRVMALRSDNDPGTPDILPESGTMVCRFTLENLLRNTFTLSVVAQGRERAILDKVDSVAMLHIEARSLAAHGRTRHAGNILYMPSEWTLRAEAGMGKAELSAAS